MKMITRPKMDKWKQRRMRQRLRKFIQDPQLGFSPPSSVSAERVSVGSEGKDGRLKSMYY
jgi:hypothetical protein